MEKRLIKKTLKKVLYTWFIAKGQMLRIHSYVFPVSEHKQRREHHHGDVERDGVIEHVEEPGERGKVGEQVTTVLGYLKILLEAR